MRNRLRKKKGLLPRGAMRKYSGLIEYGMICLSPEQKAVLDILEDNQRRLNAGLDELLPLPEQGLLK